MQHPSAGFTLIEVLVAMVIFSIVSLATVQLMVGSTSMVAENALASEAIAIAQETLEDIRAMPFGLMDSGSISVPSSKGGVIFEVDWEVVNNTPIVGVNTVGVSVAWNLKGTEKRYETESMFVRVASTL